MPLVVSVALELEVLVPLFDLDRVIERDMVRVTVEVGVSVGVGDTEGITLRLLVLVGVIELVGVVGVP